MRSVFLFLVASGCVLRPAVRDDPVESGATGVDSESATGGETADETSGETSGETNGSADDSVEQVPGVHPGDALFSDDEVHALSLELDEAAWNDLLVAPTTYVQAVFSDGTVSLDVGIRLKGYSSYEPLTGKPNFKVSFDHYVDGGRYDGLEAVDLVSEVEDPAAMSEALAYRLFREAGQPASRTGFAWLTVNAMDYGLYTLVEKKDDVLIDQWWPDDHHGSLYESSSEHWPCDFDDDGAPRCDCWEQDEVGRDDSRTDLEALCTLATDTAAEGWYSAVVDAVDWEEISRHMAMEMVLDAWDHYAGYMGNVYLYHSPEAERWSLLPASINSAFGSTRYVAGSCGGSGRTLTDFDGGLLIRRCWDDRTCAAEQLEAVRWAVDSLEASDVLATIDAWETLLEPYVGADPKSGYTLDQFHAQVHCIRDWLAARPAELAPELPAECLGEGGDLDVGGWGDLSSNGSCDRSWPDAVAYRVVDLDDATIALDAAPDGIEAGDEVILVLMQGVAGEHDEVGSFAFGDVAAVGATGLVLDEAPDIVVSGDLADWKLVLQRVPHYGNVVVRTGGTLTGGAWNGETGGILAIRVWGTLTVEDGGTVSAAAIGYAGGPTGGSYNIDGYQGESLEGAGIGGASSVAGYNESNGAWAANVGGGGSNVGGGGGEHAGGATASTSWNGVAHAPQAGETYGEPELSTLMMGSGGGGLVNLGGSSGPGGAGGGILYVAAGSVVAGGAGALSARGQDATNWASGTWTYGAGGGAGGSLWVVADDMDLVEGSLLATGGAGYDVVSRPGGDGGVGRIRVDCGTVNGVICSEAAMEGLADPSATVAETSALTSPGGAR
jgi:hypothetical protein